MALVILNSSEDSSPVSNGMSALILASASPRRRELLALLDCPFSVTPADIEEVPRADERPNDYVTRLAREKARAVQQRNPEAWVLGSDTIVVIGDEILEKPVDESHYRHMMRQLSGATHAVMTAVSLVNSSQQLEACVTTQVDFRLLSEDDMSRYWATGEPQDKAGGYGIQGKAGKFVTAIRGSYTAVVGLPLYETEQLLIAAGLFPFTPGAQS